MSTRRSERKWRKESTYPVRKKRIVFGFAFLQIALRIRLTCVAHADRLHWRYF